MLKGRIIKNISNDYLVATSDNLYKCKARGKFRNLKTIPLVGDFVEIDEKNNYILNILTRKNELKRPNVANIDIALIVMSLKNPDLSLNLLDKLLTSIILAHVEPVICFTKIDLLTKEEYAKFNQIKSYYESLGYQVFLNDQISALKKYIHHKYLVLTGQTGAGKSSLLNKLDSTLNLKVGDISQALNRGKHTTRHSEFYHIEDFYVCDTPGFSALDLSIYTKEQIKSTFKEFLKYPCPFKDCLHINEQECSVKKALLTNSLMASRYENYVKFISEV